MLFVGTYTQLQRKVASQLGRTTVQVHPMWVNAAYGYLTHHPLPKLFQIQPFKALYHYFLFQFHFSYVAFTDRQAVATGSFIGYILDGSNQNPLSDIFFSTMYAVSHGNPRWLR